MPPVCSIARVSNRKVAEMRPSSPQSAKVMAIDPLPSLSTMLKWEGPLSFRGSA